MTAPGVALADGSDVSPKVAIGFSNLVARLDDDEIGLAKAEYRVHILEALRAAGFEAVGAESLVFGKDEADRADLMLGGTVTELKCTRVSRRLRCSVGIEWQVLDRERDQVVYRVLSRHAELALPDDNPAVAGRKLTLGALRSLMTRERFKALANAPRAAPPKDEQYAPATFTSCDVPARELPASFETIAAGTVLIKSGAATGSGFVLSPDGLVMTAAHVVASGTPQVRTRDGRGLPARVVRLSTKQDVALLWLGSTAGPLACLALETARQTPGNDVYAIGSPGGEQLAFSLSRGIVSGLRTVGDVELLQTDTPINPGNSGGPLVDRQGRVVGVVSRKIAGHAVEGLGFAIPIRAGLAALKVEPAASTSADLQRAPAAAPSPTSTATQSVEDLPDAPVSLDPDGDRRRAQDEDYARRRREQQANTPGYVKPLRWVGLGVGVTGAVVASWVWVEFAHSKDNMSRPEYEGLRLKNDLAWGTSLLGFGAFAASYLLVPKLAPSRAWNGGRWQVAAGPASIRLNVSFR